MELEQAKRLLEKDLLESPDNRALCPCCLRKIGIYKHQINPDKARFLIHFYQEYEQEWGNSQKVRRQWPGLDKRDQGKLRYWQLFEPQGSPRSNSWRITDLGVAYILKEIAVPKYVYSLNNEVVKHEGQDLFISDVLAPKYKYEDFVRDL